ncbi:Protein of unknown function [Salinihabitans flavidus]|uniref:Flagellar protein n=1 Tax=Salinihabitans flavidus TaxID=569882 RepID=A0A1H8LPV2_9RHOB|nr:DUF1217 domain-containing protein [Salinihabitans flavidus]SEO07147.1 Protein of unknown function [Salinihabitans flavidus]
MSFQPILPGGGLVGWAFLQRTMAEQKAAFENTPAISRDTDHFKEKIGGIKTAEDLVDDRRLLRVALGAFGLQDDIDNRFFVRKLLEEGTLKQDSLANRMADKRYVAFVKAFGFGDFDTPRTQLSTFGAEIVGKYRDRAFEVAVGEQEEPMRLALNAARELEDLANSSVSDNAKWFTIMGAPPLRSVFETALGLPASFGQIDLDQQLETLRSKTQRMTGNGEISQFADPEKREDLIQRFMLMSQIAEVTTYSAGSVALTLLRS